MEEDSTESGTTSIQAETQIQNCDEEADDSQNSQKPEEGNGNDDGANDGEVELMEGEEELCVRAEEAVQQEVADITNTQRDGDSLLQSHLSTVEEMTATSAPSHPSVTQNQPPDPCWYCLRSLDSDHRAQVTEQWQEDPEPEPILSSSGQKVSYQTDPRPHFGVACSSHSTCRPLWGSEGPYWGQRNQEMPDQTDTCPHCHLGLPPDTLRWHEAKCLLFDGLRSSKE